MGKAYVELGPHEFVLLTPIFTLCDLCLERVRIANDRGKTNGKAVAERRPA